MAEQRSEFDSPWKEVIEAYFQDFLAFFFPYIHADVDWSGLKDLPPPAPRVRDEQAFELFYDLAAAPWLVLGADLQVVAPGMATTTAVFSGLRMMIRL